MNNVQGTVSRIWHNHRPDGSEYWVLSINGQRYSTWDRNLIVGVQKGDLVEFAFADSGRYLSLTGLRRVSGPGFTTADRLEASPEALRKVRMSCLRTAAELVSGCNMMPDQKVSLAVSVAERLEKHVLRTTDLLASQASATENEGSTTASESLQEGRA